MSRNSQITRLGSTRGPRSGRKRGYRSLNLAGVQYEPEELPINFLGSPEEEAAARAAVRAEREAREQETYEALTYEPLGGWLDVGEVAQAGGAGRRRRSGAVVALAVAVGIGLVLLGKGAGSGTNAATSATSAASVPGATSTSGPALLGSTAVSFTAAFGAPQATGNEVRSYTATLSGRAAFIRAMLVAPGDGSRVRFVEVRPASASGSWDGATAAAIAMTFAPSDAATQGDVQVSGFGTEHLFQSAQLASLFSPSAFTDATTGATVPPGTFYVACGTSDEPQGGCTLQLGE